MYKLLVVDDEPVIADGIANTIPWGDINVKPIGCAYNGYEALEKVRQSKPDIIITDVKMDNMDGLTLVNEVNKSHPFIKFIIVSGHDDTDYLRRSLDLKVFSYLLKPAGEQELLRVVNQQIQAIEKEKQLAEKIEMINHELNINHSLFLERFLTDLIQGKVGAGDEFEKRAVFLDVEFTQESYCCVIFSIHESYLMLKSDSFIKLQNYLLSIEEVVKNIWVGEVWPIHIASNSLLVILGSNDISGGLELVLESLEKFVDAPVAAAAGEPYEHITDIWMSYKQAVLAQEGNTTPELPGIITINEVAASSGLRFIYPIEKENRLFAYFFRINREIDIEEMLKDYFDSMESQGCSIERMRVEVMGFLILLVRKAYDMGFDALSEMDIALPDLYNHLSMCTVRHDLENLLIKLLKDTWAITQAKQISRISAKIAKATQYLSENYDDCDMSLDLIAEHLQMNPSYFSRLYKKETGLNFIETLTSMRLEKAKPLLASTDKKISDIASMVGYRNAKYFWNIFKTANGISPSDYRKLNRK